MSAAPRLTRSQHQRHERLEVDPRVALTRDAQVLAAGGRSGCGATALNGSQALMWR